MVYCVIVVLLLAFITFVCSNEVSSKYKLFIKTFLCLMQRNPTTNGIYSILYKGFSCIASQQVILQNTFSICDLFKLIKVAIATLNEEIYPEMVTL